MTFIEDAYRKIIWEYSSNGLKFVAVFYDLSKKSTHPKFNNKFSLIENGLWSKSHKKGYPQTTHYRIFLVCSQQWDQLACCFHFNFPFALSSSIGHHPFRLHFIWFIIWCFFNLLAKLQRLA